MIELLEKEYRGALIRSRVRMVEGEQEPANILKTKERTREQVKRISELQLEGDVVSQESGIEQALADTYAELLRQKTVHTGEALHKF